LRNEKILILAQNASGAIFPQISRVQLHAHDQLRNEVFLAVNLSVLLSSVC